MDVLTDDHEREELVRQWWHEYWKPIALGIVLAIGGLLGYRQWQAYELEKAQEQALAMYQIQTKLALKQESAQADADKFISEHKDIYGSLLSLDLALANAGKEDYQAALANVQFARDNGGDLVKAPAALTLARIQAQLKDYDAAVKTLSEIKDKAYVIESAEVLGDVYTAKGDEKAARDAYKKAIDESVARRAPINNLLQMKFDSVSLKGDTPAFMTARENDAEIMKQGGQTE